MSSNNLPLILAVDDERANLNLLERLLKGRYRIMCVSSGQDALDMLVQAPFDLILLDIMMPDMGGMETLKRIRARVDTADTPVILISALSDAHDISHGLEAGANDYIIKPIDMDVTLARVQTQLALKQLQDERKHTISDLQAAQETKNRLLRIASHDLKGPIMNLRMVVGLLDRSVNNIPGGADLLEAAESSLDTMQMVIKDFLDTAALNMGAPDLKLEGVPLRLLIDELMTEHQVNALRKNITLQAQDIDGTVQADAARFHQVLGNLVSNAIKYSPPDSTVQVWTECDDISVSIYVADQGPGIPAADQDRLFTQFGKLTPRPTGGEDSTGLGLWIVKHLVNLQNGEVGYTPRPEGGSIFWVRMMTA
jgi:two-component system, sensor histidine kinase and response regulator